MKHGKLLLFAVLSLPFLITSCKKDSNNVEPPPAPSIVGTWNLTYQSDTLIYGVQTLTNMVIASDKLYKVVNFQSDGTVYTTKSFTVGTGIYGTSMFFAVSAVIPVTTDTSKYTVKNSVITITKNSSSDNDTIVAMDRNRLVLSNSLSQAYKTTWYYSK